MTSSVSKPSSLSTSFCRRLVSFSASLTRFSAYNDNVPLNNGFTSHVGRRVKLKFATVETRRRRVKIFSRSRSNSSSIKLPPRCHFQSTSRRSLGKKTRSDSDESRVDSVRLLRIVGPAATMFGHAASVVFVMATSSL